MLIRLLLVPMLALVVSGCASTPLKTQNEQMGSRVTELERNSQAKDAEIADLQNQVKDLSDKVDTLKPVDSDQISQVSQDPTDQGESAGIPDISDYPPIIHVKVSPKRIQRALKLAGVYPGPVDGKIGPGTKVAIIKFQRRHGLKSDGILGKDTWDKLKVFLKRQ